MNLIQVQHLLAVDEPVPDRSIVGDMLEAIELASRRQRTIRQMLGVSALSTFNQYELEATIYSEGNFVEYIRILRDAIGLDFDARHLARSVLNNK